MIDLIHAVLKYEFMRQAFFAGTLAAILAGLIGYFAIVRNLAFAAHALGHIGFAGASGALLLGLSPIMGQLGLTMLAALSMGALGDRIHKNDMAIGSILSFCLGLGTLFLYLHHGFAGQATVILFGNLFGTAPEDLYIMLALLVVGILVLSVALRPLFFSSIEPDLAEAKGISLFWTGILFIVLLAFAVTLASQVVGAILVFTLIVGPAAVAVQWTYQLWSGLLMSVLLSVGMVWASIALSYWTDWPISFWVSTLAFLLYMGSSVYRSLLNNKTY